MKFSVTLKNWPWSDEGRFLDIDIVIKVPPGRMVKEESPASGGQGQGNPAAFSLGSNATAYFSRKVSAHNCIVENNVHG